jgi:hypothetical protein
VYIEAISLGRILYIVLSHQEKIQQSYHVHLIADEAQKNPPSPCHSYALSPLPVDGEGWGWGLMTAEFFFKIPSHSSRE